MKSFKYIWLLCLTVVAVGFASCDNDDDNYESKPIEIKQIYLEDYKSAVPDRPVDFARLGQLIRIEGSGFMGIKRVYINGYNTYFNLAYMTDNSMLVNIQTKTPVIDAPDDVRNIIRLEKSSTNFLEHPFTIRAASPTATSVSNTLPKAGEKVTVYGTGLHETTKVTLPGNVEVTNIESDEDGEWYSFTMPSGITANGSIYSEGANGIAATPPYFNFDSCVILDFDGKGSQGFWSWSETGSMIDDTDLVEDPAASGRGLCVQIVPQRLLDSGSAVAGKARIAECWTAGDGPTDDWSTMYSSIPATTPVTEVAFQFDIYVPDTWIGTGHLQISLFNNFNFTGIGSDDDASNKETAFCVPWIQDGKAIPFTTPGWQTITIPFSEFGKYKAMLEDTGATAPTFKNVVDDRSAASYPNFGIGFVNTDFTYEGLTVTSTSFNTQVYLDNWRIVPCESIEISDFNDEESAE